MDPASEVGKNQPVHGPELAGQRGALLDVGHPCNALFHKPGGNVRIVGGVNVDLTRAGLAAFDETRLDPANAAINVGRHREHGAGFPVFAEPFESFVEHGLRAFLIDR